MGPMQRMTHPGARMPGPMNPVSPMNPAVSITSKVLTVKSLNFQTLNRNSFGIIIEKCLQKIQIE